jgi:hypothetical protein
LPIVHLLTRRAPEKMYLMAKTLFFPYPLKLVAITLILVSPALAEEGVDSQETPETAPVFESSPAPPSPTPLTEVEPTPEPDVAPVVRQADAQRPNPRIPRYHHSRPTWGAEITGSLKALGGADLIANGKSVNSLSFQFEFQPAFLQLIGVIGFGPSFSVYRANGVTNKFVDFWGVGGQVRYQARYFRQQPIVPMAGYEIQHMRYKFSTGTDGFATAKGPFYGAWLLLNFLDPGAAAESYVESKISRTYAVFEFRDLRADTRDFSSAGKSIYFGLRFEF